MTETVFNGSLNSPITMKPRRQIRDPYRAELSPKQARILSLIQDRKCDKEIAHALNISRSTVRTHLARLFKRFGVQDRFGLALLLLDKRAFSRRKLVG